MAAVMPPNLLPGSRSAAAAYTDHKEWLESLHLAHTAHMARAQPTVSPIPSAPMMWARPDEMNGHFDAERFGSGMAGFEMPFANIALADDDFDAPVYRSLGGVMGAGAMGTLDLAVEYEDDSPRYRSCGGMPGAEQQQQLPISESDAEAAWLESMPPFIRRQQARRATFTLP